jgi:hypothetical protein
MRGRRPYALRSRRQQRGLVRRSVGQDACGGLPARRSRRRRQHQLPSFRVRALPTQNLRAVDHRAIAPSCAREKRTIK